MKAPPNTIVVDSIHGDIHLTPRERRIIDTASFQRLRQLKQLGMGHVTYPNATHTRFAHSLGVLGVMKRVAAVAKEPLNLSEEDEEDIRLAGLLHDIGHYPYSHLMERVDQIKLTEEFVEGGATITINATALPYPSHEEVGELILNEQSDLTEAIGGKERAQRIADLFRGRASGKEYLGKLIHSSLDMDRLDYLLRDAHATGVPYGRIDLNYLLNNLRTSQTGMLGVSEKALPAAEHYLFARFFMYRTVYYHKTTYSIEEACRQMLRRLCDAGTRGIAADGDKIKKIVTSKKLGEFTDAYVDRLVVDAADDDDQIVRALASAIRNRRPPKLLKEVCVFEESQKPHHAGSTFKQNCRYKLRDLAEEFKIPLRQFLYCESRPLLLEQRGSRLSEEQARKLEPEEKEELIKVFLPGQNEPVSIVSIDHSVTRVCSNYFFQYFRLYVVCSPDVEDETIDKLRERVRNWNRS